MHAHARHYKARKKYAPKERKKRRCVQLSKVTESKMSKCDDEKSDLSDDLEDEILTMKMKLSVLSLRLDEVAAMQIHIEEWLYTLHRDDIMSSILLLH